MLSMWYQTEGESPELRMSACALTWEASRELQELLEFRHQYWHLRCTKRSLGGRDF